MVKSLTLYLDDSGTRRPDKKPGKRPAHGYDWFALGGVLVKDEDEDECRRLHSAFCDSWGIKDYPIHSVEIRARNINFLWLEALPEASRAAFFESLYQLMRDAPAIGLACVIDRPGYNKRYEEMYAGERWLLCKTAFNIALERGAKYARSIGYRMRVAPERCNKKDDARLKSYYEDLLAVGMPFAAGSSDKYTPMAATDFRQVLYGFRPKAKASPMAQFADLYLWPICMGGYNANNLPYRRLLEDGKLIESHIDQGDWPALATKYSCFESVARKP